jgi:hypothetical protein
MLCINTKIVQNQDDKYALQILILFSFKRSNSFLRIGLKTSKLKSGFTWKKRCRWYRVSKLYVHLERRYTLDSVSSYCQHTNE